MRPVTRLPAREALYVCSNCRQEVVPRGISPLARQFRRHASSNSKSFLERTREKLWSETPPGPEDPYARKPQSLEETTKRLERFNERIRAEAEAEAEELKQRQEEAEEVEEPSNPENLASGDQYVQAETWDGLSAIGFLEEDAWKVSGPVPSVDKYRRYGRDVDLRPLPDAAHQAAVEICLMQFLGKDPVTICEVSNHHEQIQQMIDSCTVEVSESTKWADALRFPDQNSMEALVFVFNQIGGKTHEEIKSPENFIVESKETKKRIVLQTSRPLSLADSAVKFAFVKRLTQLLGRRIPDYAITSSNTVGEIITALSAPVKEKSPDVNKTMSKGFAAGKLPPNLMFSKNRISPGDKDEDFGRKKAIHAELYSRGLILEKKARPAGLE